MPFLSFFFFDLKKYNCSKKIDFMRSFVLKTILIVSRIWQNWKKCGSSLKKKVFSLATYAKMVKKMGYPSKRYKISPMTYFSVLISIVPSKYDFFLPFLITLDLKIFIFHQKKCESPRVSTSLVLETRKLVFLGLIKK